MRPETPRRHCPSSGGGSQSGTWGLRRRRGVSLPDEAQGRSDHQAGTRHAQKSSQVHGAGMVERKLKTALDESRLLILGAQVLFGFQFQSAFQDRFEEFSPLSRACLACSLILLLVSVVLLIAPSLHHQICFAGESRWDAVRTASSYAGWS